jgi:5-methylcytosine-specific restriction endonuclease McrA
MLAGEIHYFTGEPCKYGHVAKRWISTKMCISCAAVTRASRAEVNREYHRKVYWMTRTPKTHFPTLDPSYHSMYSKQHYIENKASYRARDRRRRAVVAGLSEHHTQQDIDRLFTAQRKKCACCRVSISSSYEVDHIKAISRGGSNAAANIQLLCRDCNRSKRARDPIDFMQSRGFLL